MVRVVCRDLKKREFNCSWRTPFFSSPNLRGGVGELAGDVENVHRILNRQPTSRSRSFSSKTDGVVVRAVRIRSGKFKWLR